MALHWIEKEVEGGNDGIAQLRSDIPNGVKLTDLKDGTKILIPDISALNPQETNQYTAKDANGAVWSQCKNPATGGLFIANPSGKPENWIEVKNTRASSGTNPGDVAGKYHIELDITITKL